MSEQHQVHNHKRITEVRSLTGLRGIAAMFVVIHHYLIPIRLTSPSWVLIGHGYLAVDLFFSLSGFVMAMNYASMFRGRLSILSFKIFIARRLARIYPLYLFTLSIAALLVANKLLEFRDKSFTEVFWTNVTLIQNWGTWGSMNPPSWSISAEFFVYLLFPLLIPFVMFRGRTTRLLLAFSCIGLIISGGFYSALMAHAGFTLNFFTGPLSLLRCVSEFTLGLIAYQYASTRQGKHWLGSEFVTAILSFVIITGLMVRDTDALLALTFPLLIVALDGHKTLLSRILESYPVHYLGLLSFSIYLSHWLFNPLLGYLDQLARHHGASHSHALAMAAVLPIVLVWSIGSYHYVEIPGRKLLRSLLERGAPQPSSRF